MGIKGLNDAFNKLYMYACLVRDSVAFYELFQIKTEHFKYIGHVKWQMFYSLSEKISE